MKQIFLFVLMVILGGLSRDTKGQDIGLDKKKLSEPFEITYKQIKDGSLDLHFYYPGDFDFSKSYPAVVFFHGGGWIGGGLHQFEPHARYFNTRGVMCVLAEYRVENKHGTTPFEAAKDAKSAMRFVRKHAGRLKIDPDQIVAAGGSAGGNLAAFAGNVEGLNDTDDDLSVSPVPNALVLFNPVYDNGPNGYGYDRIGDRYKEISPIHNISEGAPPTIVFLGTEDELIPVETAEKYKALMEEAGSRCDLYLYEGQEHAFFNYKNHEYFLKTVYEMDKFLSSLGYISGKPTIHAYEHDKPFIERIQPVPRESGFKMEGYFVWGGSVVKVEDTYHMFASRWPVETTFPRGYFNHSEIVRATSKDPMGPYTFQEVIIGEREGSYWDANMAHNPHIMKIGDEYVLFYIGRDHAENYPEGERLVRRVGYAVANDIEGPWRRSDDPLISVESNNPAVFVEPDQSVKMIYRDEKLRTYMATAPSYKGPYTVKNDNVWPEAKIEDFYLYKRDGKYHLITEDNKAGITGHERWGGHLVSDDGIHDWQRHDPVVFYDHDIRFDDGTSMHCTRRERPQLLIEDGKVKALFTSVYDGTNTWCQGVPVFPPLDLNGGHDEEVALKPASELNIRKGLPNFFSKINGMKPLTIAYLGGSITQQPGYRVYSFEWLKENFPGTNFRQIQAAIGGTTSRLGVFRLEKDVLKHDPDLIFVEFAVNDESLTNDEIYESMEGIVRKTWTHDPETDICFVYTLKDSYLETIKKGNLTRTMSVMEDIAGYYQIPSVHFGNEVVEMIGQGEMIFEGEKPDDFNKKPIVFSGDGVHPFPESGHKVYAKVLNRSLSAMQEQADSSRKHDIPAPLTRDNYEDARLVPVNRDMLVGDWKEVTDALPELVGYYDKVPVMPVLWDSGQEGAFLECRFTGTFLGIYDVMGPDCGKLVVNLDDQPGRELFRFDKYTVAHRMNNLVIDSELEKGEHIARISISGEQLDKRSMLKEARRYRYDENPEKFEGHHWYPSMLMIRGNILE